MLRTHPVEEEEEKEEPEDLGLGVKVWSSMALETPPCPVLYPPLSPHLDL